MSNLLKLGTQFFAEDDFSEVDTSGDAFDFDFSEDIEPATETEQVDTPVDQVAEQVEQNTPVVATETYKVKYNGEEVEQTIEELITNAQKGMNYDKVYTEREELKSAKEFELLDRLAKENNMSREQYIFAIEKQREQDEINRLSESGMPPAVAERIYSLERAERERAEADRLVQEKQATQQQYADFATEYPDIKEFPPEVITKIAQGETPVNAYRAFENKQLKQELQTLKQNKTNATTATGSLIGSQPNTDQDAFLAGFNSVF